jgi:beta-galactosidase
VAIVDAKGNIVPTAENEIQFFVSGDGTLAGVANGDPISHELNVAPQRKAFHGLAMVLVSAADHPGAISVRVQADGLPTASITIPVVVDPSSFAHHSQQ